MAQKRQSSGEGDLGESCELQCIRQDNTLQEFQGPVKLLIVEPPLDEIKGRISMGALLNFANLLIGAVNMITFYYSYISKLPYFICLHIVACCVGFQLFLPSAFLMLNPNFGGATQLKNRHRKSQHAFLTDIALLFGITGALHILCYLNFKYFPYTVHTVAGVIVFINAENDVSFTLKDQRQHTLVLAVGISTLVCAVVAFFIGPLIYYTDQCTPKEEKRLKLFKYAHVTFGVAAFVASMICLISSFYKRTFQKWSLIIQLRELPWILTVFVLIYAILVLRGVEWKMRYNNTREIPMPK